MLYSQANQSSTIRKLSIVEYVNVLGVVVFKILCVVYGHGRTCQFLASWVVDVCPGRRACCSLPTNPASSFCVSLLDALLSPPTLALAEAALPRKPPAGPLSAPLCIERYSRVAATT